MNEYLDITQWALLVGAVMPLLVGIITKQVANAAVKATTLLVLNAINGILTDWFATPSGFDLKGAVVNALAGLVVSVGTYFGFYRYTISPALNRATAAIGFGQPRAEDSYRSAA